MTNSMILFIIYMLTWGDLAASHIHHPKTQTPHCTGTSLSQTRQKQYASVDVYPAPIKEINIVYSTPTKLLFTYGPYSFTVTSLRCTNFPRNKANNKPTFSICEERSRDIASTSLRARWIGYLVERIFLRWLKIAWTAERIFSSSVAASRSLRGKSFIRGA